MSFTQARHLIAAALIAGVLAYLGVRLSYGTLPTLPPLAGATLLLVAGVDLVLALNIRPRVQRKPGYEPVDGITAARSVALAKASSMAGAIMGGVWVAVLIYVAPQLGTIDVAASDAVSAGIGLVSAAALIAAGLWLEHCLRNPDQDDQDEN